MPVNDWDDDIEKVLDNIRINSLYLSDKHKIRYFSLSNSIKWYRLPIIMFSGANSIISVGLQEYVAQSVLSLTTSLISLLCSIIGSIELYLKKNARMEADLISYTNFYLLSVEIYKTLTLHRGNRPIPAREYLQKMFNEYTRLVESSNPLETSITDKLLPIHLYRSVILPLNNQQQQQQQPLAITNNVLGLTHSAEEDRL